MLNNTLTVEKKLDKFIFAYTIALPRLQKRDWKVSGFLDRRERMKTVR